MIPASDIAIDGERAWWAVGDDAWRKISEIKNGGIVSLNRPCDTCDGDGDEGGTHDCDHCRGSERHTFDIEAANRITEDYGHYIETLRVHVVRVLPIVEPTDVSDSDYPVPPESAPDALFYDPKAKEWFEWTAKERYVDSLKPQLPPAASPGRWAVELAIHQRKALVE